MTTNETKLKAFEGLVKNLEKQNEILTLQNTELKMQVKTQEGFVAALNKRERELISDLVHITRMLRTIKSVTNGIRIPGEDDFNLNTNIVPGNSLGSRFIW